MNFDDEVPDLCSAHVIGVACIDLDTCQRTMTRFFENRAQIAISVGRLSRELQFRVADGFHDRVIFRELFPIGLPALDPIEEGVSGALTASQISARREIEQLVAALALPIRRPGIEHGELRRLWREHVVGFYRELPHESEAAAR